MIDHKLARKLKKVGFPQKEVTPSRIREAMDYEEDDVVTYPTLSELIEECGQCVLLISEDGQTIASHGIEGQGGKQTHGKKPDIAVAKLYIELNDHEV